MKKILSLLLPVILFLTGCSSNKIIDRFSGSQPIETEQNTAPEQDTYSVWTHEPKKEDEPTAKLNYDNDIPASVAVTKTHPASVIDELISAVNPGTDFVTFDMLASEFYIKAECIRKTFQGYYYIVLKLDDNTKAFIFMSNDLQLAQIHVADKFCKRSDFDFVKPRLTERSEIERIDKYPLSFSVSVVAKKAHILSDGYIIITYTYETDDEMNIKHIVDSVRFLNDDDFAAAFANGDFDAFSTPYILPIDRNDF